MSAESAARQELMAAAWAYVEACEKAHLAAALREQRARRIRDVVNQGSQEKVSACPVPLLDEETQRAIRAGARVDALLMLCAREEIQPAG